MSFSISFYLRNQKSIYCQLTINGMNTVAKAIKKNVPNPRFWDGRYYRDPKQRTLSNEINEFVQNYYDKLENICMSFAHDPSFTSIRAFKLMKVEDGQVTPDKPFTMIKASKYYLEKKKLAKNSNDLYQNIIDNVLSDFLMSYYNVEDLPLIQVKSRVAKDFRSYLDNQKYSQSTTRVYVGFMGAVINYIMDDFPYDEYPEVGIMINHFNSKKVKPSKVITRKLEFINPSSLPKLWQLYYSMSDGKDKDRVFIALWLWNTGMSFSDIYQPFEIVKDINMGEMFHYHRKKTKELARVVITYDLKEMLKLYEEKKKEHIAMYGFHLPISYPMTKVVYQRFYEWCRSYLSAAIGHEGNLTPHVLRHSFAVRLLDIGYSMDSVSKQMGHTTISTTEDSYGFITNTKMLREHKMIVDRNNQNRDAV